MPQSLAVYTSDGKQRDYAVPFVYIKKEYVRAIGVQFGARGERKLPAAPLPFTWVNDGLIRLDRPYPAGGRVMIQRWTHADSSLVDYQDAAVITEADLDLGDRQGLHVAQEARDNLAREIEDVRKDAQAIAEEIFDQEGRVSRHASTHALDGADPVTPASIGAPSLPPANGRPHLATATGWVEFIPAEMPGSDGTRAAMQIHHFTTDGSATEYAISHTLNSIDVAVHVFDDATGERVYFAETVRDANTVVLATTKAAPEGMTFRVVLLAPGGKEQRPAHEHVQAEPAEVWEIAHKLGERLPHLHVFDDEGNLMVGAPDWATATEDALSIHFCAPVSGKAVLTL